MRKWRWIAAGIWFSLVVFVFLVKPLQADPAAKQDPDPTPEPTATPTIDWSQAPLPGHPESAPTPPPVEPTEEATQEATAPAPERPLPEPSEEHLPDVPQTPAPAPVPTEPAGSGQYVVQRGDSLYKIARRLGVDVNELIAANDMTNPSLIYAGQTLIIPGASAPPPTPPSEPPAEEIGDEPAAAADSYVVQRGDSLYKIARRFGTTVQALVNANSITNPNLLQVGQVLTITGPEPVATATATPPPEPAATSEPIQPTETPPAEPAGGNVYVVKRGDTLNVIAGQFGTTIQAIAAANNISNVNLLYVGQQLTIPGEFATGDEIPATTDDTPGPAPATAPNSGPVIWPVESRDIINYYTYWHPAIDMPLPIGTPVVASAAGVVEYAGWNGYGYGNLIVLNHGDGNRTIYAHLDSMSVKTDQEVAQGQLIGATGSTGYSTIPHLHYELTLNYRKVDPCEHLPGGCQ